MNRYIYSFEELTPYPGYDMLVAGYAEINWEKYPAEPDVGVMRSGISFDIEAIFIYATMKGKAAMSVTPGSDLYHLIEKQLFEAHDTTIEHEIQYTQQI